MRVLPVLCLVSIAALVAPQRAEAQSLADGLAAPGGTQPRIDPDEVPEPPGATVAAGDGVRYPIPSPEGAAELATQSEEPTIRIPSRITTRLRSLDANLRALAASGGNDIVNAVLSLLTGGLAITLGILREPNTDELSIYLYLYGGAAAARGILDLVLSPNASGPSIAYQHMPMATSAQVRERLDYGEQGLSSLAEQSLIARILDATLNLAAGAAILPILAARDFAFVDPVDYFVLIGAGVSVVSGIITLATTSSAEQRWDAYQRLRERLQRERAEELNGGSDHDADEASLLYRASNDDVRWNLAVAPSPTGGYAGLTLQF